MGGGTNIILIGPPGSGKTVCGQQLAQRLGWIFLDTDQQIEKRTGLTVGRIFAKKGEAYFRQLESKLILELCRLQLAGHVIACGGGLPVAAGNFSALLDLGSLFYLQAKPEVLLKRIEDSREIRPLLAGQPSAVGMRSPAACLAGQDNLALTRLRDLLSKRAAVYKQARYQVDTTRLSVAEVVDVILKLFSPGNQEA